jgi:hypothetical protein
MPLHEDMQTCRHADMPLLLDTATQQEGHTCLVHSHTFHAVGAPEPSKRDEMQPSSPSCVVLQDPCTSTACFPRSARHRHLNQHGQQCWRPSGSSASISSWGPPTNVAATKQMRLFTAQSKNRMGL